MMLENISMYPDEPNSKMNAPGNQDFQSLKRNMKLDLNTTKPLKPKFSILSSPDLNLLKLGSPELEKLIIQNQTVNSLQTNTLNTPGTNAFAFTTPTPTPSQYFFPNPKNVTEEQELYARGFLDALSQLHDNPEAATALAKNVRSVQQQQQQIQQQPINAHQRAQATGQYSVIQQVPASCSVITSPVITTLNPVNTSGGCACITVPSTSFSVTAPSESVIISLNSTEAVLPSTLESDNASTSGCNVKVEYEEDTTMSTISDGSSMSGYQPQNTYICSVKEDSQLVPSISGTPPLSPIDLQAQELIKLERKRLRNRVAAEKCRKRKLEKINVLEGQVKQLKVDITDLEQARETLKQEVMMLKQHVQEHINAGCQIVLPS